MVIALSIVSALFAISEALTVIPGVKANGIFQAIYNGLKSLKEFLTPKAS
jgi:hypothetical protein